MFNVTLISTYDLGHQPFGLASPAAWLEAAGAEVTCVDLSLRPFQSQTVQSANLIAFYLTMHTATRLTADLLPRVRQSHPNAALCCYGLYAPVSETLLRERGADSLVTAARQRP